MLNDSNNDDNDDGNDNNNSDDDDNDDDFVPYFSNKTLSPVANATTKHLEFLPLR